MNWQDVLTAMLPEHVLLLGMLLLLGLEIYTGRERGGFLLAVATLVVAGLAALWLTCTGYAGAPFPGHYSINAAGALSKVVLLAFALPVLLVSRDDFEEGRYYVLLLASLYGACLLVSSDSFATLFLGLEIMSLPVYVLVLLGFLRPESTEAALKYLVLGGTATATLLMGVSLLYGWGASLDLTLFGSALGSADTLAAAGAALIIAALFLKAAIVPLHAWAPDAYEGASVPVTAYMATVIKAGVLLAALRLFSTAALSGPMAALLAALPLVSMAWGNIAAIRQTSFRRMIAYSSIAHAGYLFYAFLGAGEGRYEAIVFYLVAYGLMNLLAFAGPATGRGRHHARPPRRVQGPLPAQALCRRDDRGRDAVARGPAAAARLRGQVPGVPQRGRRRLHDVRGTRPRGELPRHLLLPAGDPVHVHGRDGSRRGPWARAALRLRRKHAVPGACRIARRVPGVVPEPAVARAARPGYRATHDLGHDAAPGDRDFARGRNRRGIEPGARGYHATHDLGRTDPLLSHRSR